MRLTLRTLLAYMDGILEPEQAEILRKKIEESEFAKKLMERIREVTRRLRLGAPSVGEKGALLDPNTVAEYLDNTLHGDRVPDFEKVCLESDMYLAEVASCHQILTMILGEPAEIDPVTRQKMYQLPAEAASKANEEPQTPAEASGTGAGGEPKPAGAAEAGAPGREAAGVGPGGLLPLPQPSLKTQRFWLAAALLFLAGFTTMILLGAFGMLEPGKFFAWLGISQPAPSQQPAEQPPLPPSPSRESDKAPYSDGGQKPPVGKTLSQPETLLPPTKQEVKTPPLEKVPQAPLPEDIQKPAPSALEKEKPAPEGKLPGEKPQPEEGPGVPSEKLRPAEHPPGQKPPSAEKPPIEARQLLGRLVSDREVLLRLGPEQWWRRVAPQGNVYSAERLLALPTFRPVLGLSAGVSLTLIGPTELELLPMGPEIPPGIKLLFGRVLLSTMGKEKVPVRLQMESPLGTLTLVDPDSTVALEVSRQHMPGNDPLHHPDPIQVELYTPRGRSVWTDPEGKSIELASGRLLRLELVWMPTGVVPKAVGKLPIGEIHQHLNGIPGAGEWKMTQWEPVPVQHLPEWVSEDTSTPLERRASPEIEQKLQADGVARVGLMELLDHRLQEVQMLAARCLTYLGEYQDLVAGLNKPEKKAEWFDTLKLLQEAVCRSPESAQMVRETLEKQYGPANAPLLYRMLVGYSQEQLLAGEAAALVDLLEHNELVFRVMSWWNLQTLTGKTYYYHPDAPPQKRDAAVKRWRNWLEQLKAGKISLSKEGVEPRASRPSSPTQPAGGVEVQKPIPAPSPPEAPNLPKVLPEAPSPIPAPPIPGLPPLEKTE